MGIGGDFDLTRGDSEEPRRSSILQLRHRAPLEPPPVIDDGDDWDTHNAGSLAIPRVPDAEPPSSRADAFNLTAPSSQQREIDADTAAATNPVGAGVDQSLTPTSDDHLNADQDDTIKPPVAPGAVTGSRPVNAADDDPSSRHATTTPTRSHRTRRLRTIVILGLAGLTTLVVILSSQAHRSPRTPATVTKTALSARTNADAHTLTRASAREIATAISKAYITAQATRRPHARHVVRRRSTSQHARPTTHRRSPATHHSTPPPAATSVTHTGTPSTATAQSPPSPPVATPQPSASATASTAHSSSTTNQSNHSTGASAATLLGGIGSCVKGC